MEVFGLGTDIIEIERIARVVKSNPRFADRVFTKSELEYCLGKKNCYPFLAARFAAKEAVAKAIGKSLSWQDVEIVRDPNGKPYAKLFGEALRATQGMKVLVTMSHSRDYATATAILVRDE